MLAGALHSGQQQTAKPKHFRGDSDLQRGLATSFSNSALYSGFGCLEVGVVVTILGLRDRVILEFRESLQGIPGRVCRLSLTTRISTSPVPRLWAIDMDFGWSPESKDGRCWVGELKRGVRVFSVL